MKFLILRFCGAARPVNNMRVGYNKSLAACLQLNCISMTREVDTVSISIITQHITYWSEPMAGRKKHVIKPVR